MNDKYLAYAQVLAKFLIEIKFSERFEVILTERLELMKQEGVMRDIDDFPEVHELAKTIAHFIFKQDPSLEIRQHPWIGNPLDGGLWLKAAASPEVGSGRWVVSYNYEMALSQALDDHKFRVLYPFAEAKARDWVDNALSDLINLIVLYYRKLQSRQLVVKAMMAAEHLSKPVSIPTKF